MRSINGRLLLYWNQTLFLLTALSNRRLTFAFVGNPIHYSPPVVVNHRNSLSLHRHDTSSAVSSLFRKSAIPLQFFPALNPLSLLSSSSSFIVSRCQQSHRKALNLHTLRMSNNNKWNYVQGDVSPYSSQLASEYKRCKVYHVFLVAMILLAPIVSPPLPIDVSLLAWSTPDRIHNACILALSALLCHVLVGAADLIRLNSDTYKRLNLGLLYYNLLQLFSTYLQHSSRLYILALLGIRILTLNTCFLGWIQGILTTSTSSASFADEKTKLVVKIAKELWVGTQQTFQGLFTNKNKSGGPYPLIVWGCLGLWIQSILGLLWDWMIGIPNDISPVLMGAQLSTISHYGLLFSILLALKDASERQRLSGTTFIQLNVAMGLYAFIDGIMQSIASSRVIAITNIISFSLGSIFLKKAYDGIQAKRTNP